MVDPTDAELTAPLRPVPAAPITWHDDTWDERPERAASRVVPAVAVGVTAVVVVLLAVLLAPSPESGNAVGLPTPPAGPTATAAGTITAAETTTTTSASPTTIATTIVATTPKPTSTTTLAQPPPPVTTTTPARPPRGKLPLRRYKNSAGFHYSATPATPPVSGFTMELPLGSLVAAAEPNTRRLYLCQVSGAQDRFTSADAKCENQKTVAGLGFVFTALPAGTTGKPLYRCNAGASHFDSLDARCEGRTVEGRLGFVLT